MRAYKQYNYSKPCSSNHNSKMKAKRVGTKNANTRTHAEVLSKRKLEIGKFGEKPLRCLPNGKSIY